MITASPPLPPAAASDKKNDEATVAEKKPAPRQLILGLVFGMIFGFLLQKGGVAKYHVLVGVLLLKDFTVIKVMVSAIIVGSIGVFSLKGLGLIKLHIKPTRYAANIFGGLVFGVGFGLAGYCPGTGAAALGQGNWDAIASIAGLMIGSWLYAESSRFLGETVEKWGDRGKLTIPDMTGLPLSTVLPTMITVLAIALILIERFAVR